MSYGNLKDDTAIQLFEGSDNYHELHVTDQGYIQIHAEDKMSGVTYALSVDEAKQLMAALGRQIYIAEFELD